jgi:dihydroorotate dehydrogenase electron transfer subunit
MMAAPTVARADAATLVAARPAGRYRLLTVRAPQIVRHAEPGQFVSFGVEAPRSLLRRPFAIAGVDIDASTFDVVVAVVGRGSAWLTARRPADTLDVVGPLGTGFTLPAAPARCVLVGGGYGTAALEWLGRRMLRAGCDVELLSGAATAAALYPVGRVTDGREVRLVETTEDGSRGSAGLVTEALAERLAQPPPARVFACGPMPMLAAVAAIADRHGCDCQVAVEEHMGCSVGVCMTCVVPTAEGEGERQRAGGWGAEGEGGYVRACIEGPVLDAARIDWAAVRRRAARG